MGNHLIASSSELAAPVAPGKRDVADRSAKAAESYSGVPNVGPGARRSNEAQKLERPRDDAEEERPTAPILHWRSQSDEEGGRQHRTPDLFSLTSPRDSAYGTARTVSITPRCPEELRPNPPKDIMEDMDETVAPSGTVDPSKILDESNDAAPLHISESDEEDFSVSPHTQTRASSLQRVFVPHKSTKSVKTRSTLESDEELSVPPLRTHKEELRLFTKHYPFRLGLVTRRTRRQRTIRPC